MQNRGSRDGLRLLLMCLKYVLRTQRLIRPVLAFDEDGSGLQALGVVPLAYGNAEAGAVGSGEVGRSAGGSNKAFKQGSVRGVIVLTHRAADEHNGFCRLHRHLTLL